MLHTCRTLSLGAFVLCLLVSAGCGGSSKKGSVLKGTVVLPPNVKLQESDSATVNFVPAAGGGQQFASAIKPTDLTFEASGPEGKGIAPGNYKITIRLQPYTPGESPQKRICDAINSKYDSGNSNLSYTVTEDLQQAITIDLTKGTVTKQ